MVDNEHLQILAKHCTEVFQDMAQTEVAETTIKEDEREVSEYALAQVIDYKHTQDNFEGHFVLGFPNNTVALLVASAIARQMGLEPAKEVSTEVEEILREFMNTVVGLTVTEWDKMGLALEFGPPHGLNSETLAALNSPNCHSYLIILSLGVVHVILRVMFTLPRNDLRRILIVDDSPLIRGIVARNLQEQGYETSEAENGREGVSLFEEQKPDLVIMDLVMPELGGLEALQEIRQTSPDARAIVLTSSARQDQVDSAKELGVMSYVMKPVKMPELIEAVESALGGVVQH